MAHVFTRQELFDLVWSAPTRSVAKQLGISDVGLAKACRRANLLLPPRGYWAKLAAGKKVVRPDLPARLPGMSDKVVLGSDRWNWGHDSITPDTLVPPEPTFSEPLEEIGERVRKQIGKVSVTRDLDDVHPRLVNLVVADERRRKAELESPYGTWDKPLFAAPVEQRRLRLLSSLMRALDKVDVTVSVRGRDARELSATVGNQWVSFAIDVISKVGGPKPKVRTPDSMACQIIAHHGSDEVLESWSDSDVKLERRLADIAVAIVVRGERNYRMAVAQSREWVITRKAELVEEARRRDAEQRRLERERIVRLQKARVDRLLAQARALAQADQIRAYVAAVEGRQGETTDPLTATELQEWRSWALEQAQQIDPVLNGQFRAVMLDESDSTTVAFRR